MKRGMYICVQCKKVAGEQREGLRGGRSGQGESNVSRDEQIFAKERREVEEMTLLSVSPFFYPFKAAPAALNMSKCE